MQLEKQNKRSCLGLLAVLAVILGIVVWMSLGGVSDKSLADDPKGPVGALAPPPSPRPPADNPAPARPPG
jgi:hypothetical protein